MNSVLPTPCPTIGLKAHEVRHEGLSSRPFSLARNEAGDASLLATDAARALLLYTEDVQNSRLFDDLFAHMLARKLAAWSPRLCSRAAAETSGNSNSSMPRACRKPARPQPPSSVPAAFPIPGLKPDDKESSYGLPVISAARFLRPRPCIRPRPLTTTAAGLPLRGSRRGSRCELQKAEAATARPLGNLKPVQP